MNMNGALELWDHLEGYTRGKRGTRLLRKLNSVKSLALHVVFIKSKLLDQNGCSNWFS